jgi:glycosyltransferase involved in cell wall biosynthesis
LKLAVVTSHPIQYYSPLYRELAGRADVTVYFAHKATPAQQAAAGFGAAFDWDVDLLSGFRHVFLRNVARDPSAARFSGCDAPEIAAHLAGGKFDAVLVTGWHLKVFWQTVLAARRHGVPVMVRGDSQLGTVRSRWKLAVKSVGYPLLLRLFDAILYTGKKNRDYLTHYRYPADRLFFSPHCIDTARFAAQASASDSAKLRSDLGVGEASRLLLFAGKLVPFKRPADVVRVAAALQAEDRPVEVLIAGAGALGDDVAAAAREAGVRLHPLGFCNQSRMPGVYAAADLLVLPSDARETWGLVANEALACGTPVLLSSEVGSAEDLGAYADVVRTYPCGNIDLARSQAAHLLSAPRDPARFEAVNRIYGLARAAEGILEAAARCGGSAARAAQCREVLP